MLNCHSSMPPSQAARSWSASGVVHDLSDGSAALARARGRAIDGGQLELAGRIAAVMAAVEEMADEVGGWL